MSSELFITARAYPYLVLQRGALNDMRDEPALWCQSYIKGLDAEFERLRPWLPATCDALLDIGSGMGGMDALINRHYGGQCQVTLLDGVEDEPDMVRHNQTFNHMGVAREFLGANGVHLIDHIDANNAHRTAPRFFDLVLSAKSWCFHYEPERYLDLVLSACIAGQTRIIVDVRGGSGELSDDDIERSYHWQRALSGAFRHVAVAHYGYKFETHVYEAK